MTYRVRMIRTGDGFAVWVPLLPGCRSFGRTAHEALENIRLSIISYLEALEEQNTGYDCEDVEI